ncbi:glycosyltransferase [Leptobacterium flavescens]|uniref:Glycosyltransferase n=1 Tax=Leptobacterium flavescens TaxID=472055 RepID=A0A6P0URT8_9FLAO|nr:glycosyltransferase family 2 protein [Leptobacterium flavescens]NER13583.1 glycosyltransferase [Leptobacterium flavescens]
MDHNPKISVVISTYNSEEWLTKVIWGYEAQEFREFELIIADDGSGNATRKCITDLQAKVNFPVIHVWQEDHGFQKCRILNRALMVCSADYIVMSDGDCIPRADFLLEHFRKRKKGYFLSGGCFRLPLCLSETITKTEIISGKCFDIKWLSNKGLPSSFKNNKLSATGLKSRLLNTITTTKASWNGHNSSGWKKDILAVNGFDERMQYGGEDRELGDRLANYGLRSRQIRYSAICLHLEHSRPYKTPEAIKQNRLIRKQTKENRAVWTPYGIEK